MFFLLLRNLFNTLWHPLAVSHLLTREQRLLPGRESAGLVGWSADGPVIRAAGEGVADRNLLGVGEARARHTLRLILGLFPLIPRI